MRDPYLLPNGTLRNKFGVNDPGELAWREDRAVAAREALIDNKKVVTSPFDFANLKRIHKYLFGDVYDWAGIPRTCPLQKAEHEDTSSRISMFTPPLQISTEARRIFGDLAAKRELRGLDRANFAEAAADLFVEINNFHPFREGNGRTQRAFLRNLAVCAGHDLAFDVVTRERMVAVSVAGIRGDRTAARRLFAEILDPERVAALRKALAFLKESNRVPWNDLYIATTVAGQAYRGLLVGRAGKDFMIRVSDEQQDRIIIGASDDVPSESISGDEISIRTTKF